MRFTTRINNQKCLEWGINATQAALFDLLNECAAWAKTVVVGEDVFYWVSRNLIVEELPLFFSKPDTAYRALKSLEEKGLIEYQRNGSWELVRLTKKGAAWNSHDVAVAGKKSAISEKNPNSSEKNPNSSEKNPNSSEKNPTDKYINKTTNQGTNQIGVARDARTCPRVDALTDESGNADAPKRGRGVGKPNAFNAMAALLALGVDAQVAADWLEVRKSKRAKLTQTALDALVREAGKAGISTAEAVRICAERGWQSFNAGWDWRDEKPAKPKSRHDLPTQYADGTTDEQLMREEWYAMGEAQ